MKKFEIMVLALFGALLLNGCRSDLYFQDRAVNKARTFLLKNARELTPEQVYWVKFNDPVLLHGSITGETGYSGEKEHLTSEVMQICVFWELPDTKAGYLVYGVSDRRMQQWKPIRLIRKNFVHRSDLLAPALASARAYSMNSLYPQLSARDFNHIRFMPPAVARTNFELNFNLANKLSLEEENEARLQAQEGAQFSLIWHLPDSGRYAVFTGVSQEPKFLKDWQINIADLMSETLLVKHMVEIVNVHGAAPQEAPKFTPSVKVDPNLKKSMEKITAPAAEKDR